MPDEFWRSAKEGVESFGLPYDIAKDTINGITEPYEYAKIQYQQIFEILYPELTVSRNTESYDPNDRLQ